MSVCSLKIDFRSVDGDDRNDDGDEGTSRNSKCLMLEDEGNAQWESKTSVDCWDVMLNERSFEEYFPDRSEAEAGDHRSVKVASKETTMESNNGMVDNPICACSIQFNSIRFKVN